ncbi:MAG: hypothetical protein HY814_10535, partial [Candidatus Riflebacteria bacterium]|nr:hypothetical protein [Candidatus Riflebacteria bacterium]
ANRVARLHLHGEGLDDFLGHVDPATGDWLSLPVKDHLGSVRALVTLTGAVLATQSFAAYGQLRGPPAPAALGSFGFTGRDAVEAPPLVYLRNRWYAPRVGRFASGDPIGFAGG